MFEKILIFLPSPMLFLGQTTGPYGFKLTYSFTGMYDLQKLDQLHINQIWPILWKADMFGGLI